MRKETILVTFNQGTVTIKTTGFKGAGCRKATADLEAALGTVRKTTTTPEYFERDEHEVKHGR